MASSALSRALRQLAWRQWAALGVSATDAGPSRYVVDLEALVLTTFEVGRDDPRLFDESLDWLHTNAALLSTNRLRTLCADELDQRLADAALAWLAARGRGARRARSAAPVDPPAELLQLFPGDDPRASELDSNYATFGLARAAPQRRPANRCRLISCVRNASACGSALSLAWVPRPRCSARCSLPSPRVLSTAYLPRAPAIQIGACVRRLAILCARASQASRACRAPPSSRSSATRGGRSCFHHQPTANPPGMRSSAFRATTNGRSSWRQPVDSCAGNAPLTTRSQPHISVQAPPANCGTRSRHSSCSRASRSPPRLQPGRAVPRSVRPPGRGRHPAAERAGDGVAPSPPASR